MVAEVVGNLRHANRDSEYNNCGDTSITNNGDEFSDSYCSSPDIFLPEEWIY